MTVLRRWAPRLLRFAGWSFAVLFVLLGSYLSIIRPWHIRWGATDEEFRRAMPGDEFIPDATLNTTRAITIQATPEEIWPWLVQMGYGRAGWYSYDRLDNHGRPSATRIIPELQRKLQPGEFLVKEQGHGFKIMAVEENRYVVLGPQISWALALYPQSDGSTRLVERLRAKYHWTHPQGIVLAGMLDVGDFIMMRKMLLNLKARVEAQRRARPSAAEKL